MVKGRVVNHQGAPIANAEVLLLGAERIFRGGPETPLVCARQGATEAPVDSHRQIGRLHDHKKTGACESPGVDH